MTDIEDTANEVVEDADDDVRALVNALVDRVDALEATVAGLGSGLNATPPAAETSTEAGVNSQGAEVETDNSADDDPYTFERAPIRKHGLFRRVFG